ncbi:MAG: FAD/NAD(P)-binding protein [Pseudomonadota bacterium]
MLKPLSAGATPMMANGVMTPHFATVTKRVREIPDVVTFEVPSNGVAFQPGQFNMLYAAGVGEVPISMSGDPARQDVFVHTIRDVGAVSRALTEIKRNGVVGVRGPFGTGWPVDEAKGKDVLIVAGGIGLAPLRPVIYALINEREAFGRIALIYGARSPEDLLFPKELDAWKAIQGFQVEVTVDHATREWRGNVGFVTSLLGEADVDPDETIAMLCGPEIMMQFTAGALADRGIGADQVYVSMERSMKCALGFCGHCQWGPAFVCRDGPVYSFDKIGPMMAIREL